MQRGWANAGRWCKQAHAHARPPLEGVGYAHVLPDWCTYCVVALLLVCSSVMVSVADNCFVSVMIVDITVPKLLLGKELRCKAYGMLSASA